MGYRSHETALNINGMLKIIPPGWRSKGMVFRVCNRVCKETDEKQG